MIPPEVSPAIAEKNIPFFLRIKLKTDLQILRSFCSKAQLETFHCITSDAGNDFC